MVKLDQFLIALVIIFYLLKPLIDFPDFVLHWNVNHIYQFVSIVFVLFMLYDIAKKSPRGLVWLLFVSLLLCVHTFILINNLSLGVFISQLYYLLLPIITFVWVKHNRSIYDYTLHAIVVLSRRFFKLLIFASFLYLVLHYLDVWSYYGYTTNLAFCVLLANYKKCNKNRYALSMLLDFACGKRTSLLIYPLLLLFENKKKFFLFAIVLVPILFCLNGYMPERYQSLVNVDLSSLESLFNATGGRSVEWFSILDYLYSQNSLYHGMGLGSSYPLTYDPVFYDTQETRHYVHNYILTLSLIIGLPLSIFVFSFIIYLQFKYRNYGEPSLNLYTNIMLCLSLSGASLAIEPFFWLVFWINFFLSREEYDRNILKTKS